MAILDFSMDANVLAQQLGNWTQAKGSLHQRLTAAFEHAIEQGMILPGTRCAIRAGLAEALALSRTTVLTAYNNLKADGWLESRTGSGTWVSKRRASAARHQIAFRDRGRYIHGEPAADRGHGNVGFCPRVQRAAEGASPRAVSSRCRRAGRAARRAQLYASGFAAITRGYSAAVYQAGVPTTSEEILITSGTQQALSLITSLYIQRGDAVLVENPTYFGALDIFRLAGARLSPLPVGLEHVQSRCCGIALWLRGRV